jgi:hypothetical protein
MFWVVWWGIWSFLLLFFFLNISDRCSCLGCVHRRFLSLISQTSCAWDHASSRTLLRSLSLTTRCFCPSSLLHAYEDLRNAIPLAVCTPSNLKLLIMSDEIIWHCHADSFYIPPSFVFSPFAHLSLQKPAAFDSYISVGLAVVCVLHLLFFSPSLCQIFFLPYFLSYPQLAFLPLDMSNIMAKINSKHFFMFKSCSTRIVAKYLTTQLT